MIPRVALFTPTGTTGGPERDAVESKRVTKYHLCNEDRRGRLKPEKEVNELHDEWTNPKLAHKVLVKGREWIGETTFFLKGD